MGKLKTLLFLFIITVPAFLILLNNQYFSMHDDQHIVRLFLLDQGIRQGSIYPRWVGGLGFGYGYPLYNFYPPLIYYISEFFHLIGFSLIWSVKLMIIAGFILASTGMYLLVKRILGRWPAILGATVYTYFFYHSVNVYVRGALAEFFAMTVLPFVFLSLHNLYEKRNLKNSLFFGLTLAILILVHPLIALPSVFFIGFSCIFYWLTTKHKTGFIRLFIIGTLIGLGLSSFFWLPSLTEKKFTLTDKILTQELADYKDHYVCPYQLWFSPWGYGGSGANCQSGMTFQLGKIPIALMSISLILFVSYLIKKKKTDQSVNYYLLSAFLLLFSLFMTTSYSSFIWDNIQPLSYLQFPWRFLTFTAVFISVVCSYVIYFLQKILDEIASVVSLPGNDKSMSSRAKRGGLVIPIITMIIIIITIYKYQQYFRPQYLLTTNDAVRTSFEEIAWRVSGTSYEFVPRGVATKKTALGTTTLAIDEKDLPVSPFVIANGQATVTIIKNNFSDKVFQTVSTASALFRLNTYNFPGWAASIDNKAVTISDNNPLKLISVDLPAGRHEIRFIFEDTAVRKIGNIISVLTLISVAIYWLVCGMTKYMGKPS